MNSWFASISANFMMFLLFVLGYAVQLVIFWYMSSKKSDEQVLTKIDGVERKIDRIIGWAKGAFGVNLNGD